MAVLLEKPADLADRLAAFESLAGAPRRELEWIASTGMLRHYARGEQVLHKGGEAHELLIVLTGRVVVTVEQGTGRRHAVASPAGSLTGVLPYSRLTHAIADVFTDEETDALVIDRTQFPDLIYQCPTVTTTLVHTMLDRARVFTGINWQDEKLLSLGRLAGGLAHELDNPASAAARGAKLLRLALQELGDAALTVGAAQPTPNQRALITAMLEKSSAAASQTLGSPLEQSAREDALATWLEAHGADADGAATLAEHGINTPDLERLAAALSGPLLGSALRWIAAANTAQELAEDIDRSVTRIHELVSAVKRFSYVDRAGAPEPTDIGRALTDTVAVLAARARDKSIDVTVDVEPSLPPVSANSAALNQVWSNLLENAIDAAPPSGIVSVNAACENGTIVVRVTDNGPGIPLDVQQRMFDPFFTTKEVGEGSGLGLDIARRVVRALDGQIDVDTRPGRTEFRVTLPLHRG